MKKIFVYIDSDSDYKSQLNTFSNYFKLFTSQESDEKLLFFRISGNNGVPETLQKKLHQKFPFANIWHGSAKIAPESADVLLFMQAVFDFQKNKNKSNSGFIISKDEKLKEMFFRLFEHFNVTFLSKDNFFDDMPIIEKLQDKRNKEIVSLIESWFDKHQNCAYIQKNALDSILNGKSDHFFRTEAPLWGDRFDTKTMTITRN